MRRCTLLNGFSVSHAPFFISVFVRDCPLRMMLLSESCKQKKILLQSILDENCIREINDYVFHFTHFFVICFEGEITRRACSLDSRRL